MFKQLTIQDRLLQEEAKNKALNAELQLTKEYLKEAEDALLEMAILLEEQNDWQNLLQKNQKQRG